MSPLPRVAAHRGASAEAPENTLASFRRALDLGCRALELDVHLAADGTPVVIHDDLLDRTTNGRGPVHARTVEELKRLDAGAWFGREFAGERIPTLAEVLDLARERDALLNLELKTDRNPYHGIEAAVGNLARELDVLDRIAVTSFNPATIERFHRLFPHVGTGVIVLGFPTPADVATYSPYAQALGLYLECVTSETVAIVREGKMAVVAWTVNHPEAAEHLFDLGVDGVITDDPRALRAFL